MIDFTKDYYKILHLQFQASDEQIKLAYRKLVKQFHPDLHPGNEDFEAKIRILNEAYEVLSNPDDRAVYDEYIKKADSELVTSSGYHKNKRTYTQTKTVKVEIRTYIKGKIDIKYRGYHVDNNTENIFRETFYNLRITQVDAVIQSGDMYLQQDFPDEFKTIFDLYKPFKLNIKQPVNCSVHLGHGIEHYQLAIEMLTIPEPQIINVTKHEGESFGTITGQFYGYISKNEEYELITEVTECFGETGNREERTENDIKSYRKEYFNKDCTRYWGNWVPNQLRKTFVPTGESEIKDNYFRNKYYYSDRKSSYWGNWHYRKTTSEINNLGCFSPLGSIVGIVLSILFFLFIFPRIVFLLPFILFAFLLNLLPISTWHWLSKIFGLMIIGLYLFIFIGAIMTFNKNKIAKIADSSKPPVRTDFIPVVVEKTSNLKVDTLITHFISWDDYRGKTYNGHFWVSKNAYTLAHNYKDQLPLSTNDERSYDEVIFSLKEYDKGNLEGLYQMFDSLRIGNDFSSPEFAELIVSFVQSIPYSIILPKSCDPKFYQDEFITKYLAKKDARCEGFQRFGINTPVEFLGSLNGDCDTRTLLLYTVLDHYNYDVALLSSDHYSHSILGINLPYDGMAFNYNNQRYMFWETTLQNAKPGILPDEISNANYWRISLKSK